MKPIAGTLAAAGIVLLLGHCAPPTPEQNSSHAPSPEPSPYFVTVTLDTDVFAADQAKLSLRAGDRVKVVAGFDSLLVIEHQGKRFGPLNKALTRQE